MSAILRARHCATQGDSGAFVVEIMKGGRGVAEQIVLGMAGKDLDGIHLQLGAFECGVMVEDQEVSRCEPLDCLGSRITMPWRMQRAMAWSVSSGNASPGPVA